VTENARRRLIATVTGPSCARQPPNHKDAEMTPNEFRLKPSGVQEDRSGTRHGLLDFRARNTYRTDWEELVRLVVPTASLLRRRILYSDRFRTIYAAARYEIGPYETARADQLLRTERG
jgi:hypothetical protein